MSEQRLDAPQDNETEQIEWGDVLRTAKRVDETAALTYSSRTTYVDTSTPVLIVGNDPDRERVELRIANDAALRIGTYSDVASGGGFLFDGSMKPDFVAFTQQEIYAVAQTNPANVSVWAESQR